MENNESESLKQMSLPPEGSDVAVDVQQLKEEAKQRAKTRPVLQRILSVFKGKASAYRELIINSEPLERRMALLTDGVLEKFEVERTDDDRMVGAIFKGKIQNLEPGLKAAFVDIGQPKNAFLHYWDIVPSVVDSTIEVVRENSSKEAKKMRDSDKYALKNIPSLFPIGTDIVVQVTKGQIGTKGPRVTTNISLPGRFIVLTPYSGQCGISRKIEDQSERERLKKIIRTLTLPEGMGIILRTASEGKKLRYFVRDLYILLKEWHQICEKMEANNEPTLLYQEPDLIARTVRDFLTESIDRVLIDNAQDKVRIEEEIEAISPRSKSKVFSFEEGVPIFERFNIEKQIEQTYMRKVPLPSGGEIVIDEAEALTAIDVNTGSHKVNDRDGRDFILKANMEAAKEIARQIRLRNIGGLIVIDFIDMKESRDRRQILDTMRDEMDTDKAKTQLLPISPMGIMQMTRQRHSESNASSMYTQCPYCNGRARVKSARSVSVEVQRRLINVLRKWRKDHETTTEVGIKVLLHPAVLERFRTVDKRMLQEIEQRFNAKLYFKTDPNFHIENFKTFSSATDEELR